MTEITEIKERKPLLKPKPSGKFVMHEFQEQDIAILLENEWTSCANWSEMGAMKTSTAEWLIEQKLAHIPNPRVLVITTKTGKGAYLESLGELLQEWDVFAVGTKQFHMVLGGKIVHRRDVKLPNPLYMRPVVVLAHYHCFTNRACVPQKIQETVEIGGKEVKIDKMNEDGTFAMVIPRCNELMTKHWDAIIVDEAHRMKNHDAQWTRNIKKLKAGFKHIMTGTGFVNNPAEMWSLLDFLYSGKRNSPHANLVNGTGYWKFREHFCEEDYVGGYRKIVGIKPRAEADFRQLVRDVGVRRTMLECFPNISEPIETVVPVELSAIQSRMYEGIMKELMALDAEGVPLHSPTVLSALNRLRQICVATPKVKDDYWSEKLDRRVIEVELTEPSSKLDAAMEIIDGLEWDNDRRDQVVVFSNFRQPLVLLKKRLEKARIPHLHLVSEMNDKQRYELWHEMWPEKQHQVFLSTLGVGSESINSASANRAIFLDQSWSPAQNKQAIGRIYRPGQTGVAQLIYVRAEGTVDYRVLDTVNTKHGWFKQVFGIADEDENGDDDE